MQYREAELTGCIIKVHLTLGPGFIEGVYKNALILELVKQGLQFDVERDVLIYYDEHLVGRHKIDLVVEQKVVLDLKTVEELGKAQYAQLRSELRAAKLSIGLLANFSKEKADVRRVDLPSS